MRILAVDLAGVCRRFFELDKDGRLTDGTALSASVGYIKRAADGFDRIVVARDLRPSFRHAFCPTYKAGREDPGPVYTKLEIDVCERLWRDGATVFPGNAEAKVIGIGDGYPEADDVIASLAAWLKPQDGDHLSILSNDSDLCALASDTIDIHRADGSIWGAEDVIKNIGVEPSLIRELKALAGDGADKYKPFPHHEPAAEGQKTKPGIGDEKAIALLAKWGTYGDEHVGLAPAARVLWAAQDGARWDAQPQDQRPKVDGDRLGMPDCHERRCLLAGGKAALDMGYACATLKTDVALDFARILAEPVVRPLVPAKEPPAPPPKVEAPPVPQEAAMVVQSPRSLERPRGGGELDRYALQPDRYEGQGGVWDVATELFNARMFPQFTNWQGVAGAIIVAREQGIGVGQALRGTYVVHGKLAFSAALIVGLVKREKSCKLFRLDQSKSNEKQAVVRFWHADDPAESTYKFTWEMAVRMGVTTAKRSNEKTKWETQPHLMLAWAAMRECARLHWPEVVAGMYTPDELRRGGDIGDDEFGQTAGDMDVAAQ